MFLMQMRIGYIDCMNWFTGECDVHFGVLKMC